MWPAARVRQEFVDYFTKQQEHDFVASSPVVPLNDPTLLFANAGMNQFKAVFMGQLDPSSPLQGVKRAANSQKCIRAGGKHNDLDDVGKDVYHHTFFEMLGNWSFGDYFKAEAIDFAWEVLTTVYGLEPERIYASYFGGDKAMNLPEDTEAKELWLRYLPAERILPFDKSDNFWEMGAVGPCGPCSELHYDRIGGRDAAALVNADDPDVIEIWNLVFMQFYREDSGNLTVLPSQHIDTGMGLERVTSILQDKRSNYDTDLFTPLLAAVHEQVGGAPYAGLLGEEDPDFRDTAFRIIVDHARTLTLAVADGAVPGKDGRGYVLRRILRRAVRYGRQMLSAPPGFFHKLVPAVVASLGVFYPELEASLDRVQTILKEEEEAFDRTVERGMQYFSELQAELSEAGATVVPGDRAFQLYVTQGFPLDLTQQMAEEAGLTVDMDGFEAAMAAEKEISRNALREQQEAAKGMQQLELVAEQTAWLEGKGIKPTEDSRKYDSDIKHAAVIQAIFSADGFVDSTSELPDGAGCGIVMDTTSFYAEAGGQVADVGELLSEEGAPVLSVKNVQVFGGFVLHSGLPVAGPLSVGDKVGCSVDYEHRRLIVPNHTMTHALNWALREVLGDGVDQRGSLCDSERLRFDFSADGVSTPQLQKVEDLVQGLVESGVPVSAREASLSSALEITGLRAVAGEAYPDPVRVVTIGDSAVDDLLAAPAEEKWMSQSVEFCGGTHLTNTKEAEAFVVLEERAVSKGVRRISGATGALAVAAREEGARVLERLQALEEAKAPAEADMAELSKHIDGASMSAALKPGCRDRLNALMKKTRKQNKGSAKEAVNATLASIREAAEAAASSGAKHCVIEFDGLDAKTLHKAIPEVDIAVLALTLDGGSVSCVATVPSAAAADGKPADAWVRAALAPIGGKGGGRPVKAQGSAKVESEVTLVPAVEAANAFWT